MENEIEYLQPVLGTLQCYRFKVLSTSKAALFQLLLLIVLLVVVVYSLFPVNPFIKKCDLINLIIYSQSALWFISLILDRYYKWRHRFTRLNGHFEFYRKVSKYTESSFYIISFWNAVLLAVLSFYSTFLPFFDNLCTDTNLFSSVNIIKICIILELIMLIPLKIVYLLCVYNFNKTRPIPDIEKRECWVLEDSVTASEIGYRCEGDAVADLLQKQADLIYYYKCTNDALSNKIMEFTAQIR